MSGIRQVPERNVKVPRAALLLLAGAVVAIGLGAALGRPKPRGRASASRPAPRAVPVKPSEQEAPERPPVPPVIVSSPEARKALPEPPEPSSLVLTRVVWDGDDPEATFAVISDRAVRVGDSIAGRRVVRVERNRVLFSNDRELTLDARKEGD